MHDYQLNLTFIAAQNIAPLFLELGEGPVTIERVLEVWSDKGLKDSSDQSILGFLKVCLNYY